VEILEQPQGAVIVLKPQGPLVQADAEQFRTRMFEQIRRSLGRVLIDASAIPFMDSAGLEALADVSEEMSRGGQALKLCGANDTVREVLELTDLASQFEHFEDILSGVRSFL
jgi:anti-sigma B factor antagonist